MANEKPNITFIKKKICCEIMHYYHNIIKRKKIMMMVHRINFFFFTKVNMKKKTRKLDQQVNSALSTIHPVDMRETSPHWRDVYV